MFQGHSIVVLDSKSRIVLPTKFRSKMSPESNNKIVLTRGLNGCLMLYPLDEWERVKIGLMKYNVFDEEERSFMRQFMMYVHECDLDSHNRFLLPSQLIEFAHIKKDVLLLGMLQNIEIWNPELKSEYENRNPETFESVAQKVTEKFLNKSNN